MQKYGFVYIWFDRKRSMFYIGSHWGCEDDGYVCGSTWMRNARRKRPQDFKRRTLARIGSSRSDLFNEEQRWLEMIKPHGIKPRRYYNVLRKCGQNNHMFGRAGKLHHLFGTTRTPEQGAKQSEAMKARYAANLKPHNKGRNAVFRVCPHCSNEFQTPRGKRNQVHCSKQCQNDARAKIMACKVCGKERRVNLSQVKLGHGQFCSLSCRTKFIMTPARAQDMLKKRWASFRLSHGNCRLFNGYRRRTDLGCS